MVGMTMRSIDLMVMTRRNIVGVVFRSQDKGEMKP